MPDIDTARACLCTLLEDAKAGDMLLVEMPFRDLKEQVNQWGILRAVHYGAQVRRDDGVRLSP